MGLGYIMLPLNEMIKLNTIKLTKLHETKMILNEMKLKAIESSCINQYEVKNRLTYIDLNVLKLI